LAAGPNQIHHINPMPVAAKNNILFYLTRLFLNSLAIYNLAIRGINIQLIHPRRPDVYQ